MNAKEIDQFQEGRVRYSICTLVNNHEEYSTMLDTFRKAGFKDDFCEYIYVDNSKGNKHDAYAGLNRMIAASSGKYIILCHQDLELRFDTVDVLEQRIKEVEARDKNWAILSNAGGLHLKKIFERITHPQGELSYGPFPFKVKSVDENFILLKKSAGLSFSSDMKGYHMYGTDICIIGNAMGYSAWVVDFHLYHKSTGNMNASFYENRDALIKKYRNAFRSRYIRSTCTKLYISGNRFLCLIMNTKLMIYLSKLVLKAKRRIKGDYLFD